MQEKIAILKIWIYLNGHLEWCPLPRRNVWMLKNLYRAVFWLVGKSPTVMFWNIHQKQKITWVDKLKYICQWELPPFLGYYCQFSPPLCIFHDPYSWLLIYLNVGGGDTVGIKLELSAEKRKLWGHVKNWNFHLMITTGCIPTLLLIIVSDNTPHGKKYSQTVHACIITWIFKIEPKTL